MALYHDGPNGVFVAGYTYSSGFPTTPGAYQTVYGTSIDAFVTRLNISGSALLYSTFLGGESGERGYGIVVDDAGNAYVVGEVSSNDFPVTYGSYDTTHNLGEDAFITKLNSSGTGLIYSTHLGGSSTDEGYAIALDDANRAHVTGFTYSNDFPTTPGAFDSTVNGWYDVFVARLNTAGSALDYATCIGGGDYDEGYGLAVDDAGHAYVTGLTSSINYPITAGAYDVGFNNYYDAFVTKVSPSGSTLVYSTFLGGSSYDYGYSLALDDSGRVHITGATESGNFPYTSGAWDGSHNGSLDAFVSRLDAEGAVLEYSTYLGGTNREECEGIDLENGAKSSTGDLRLVWSEPFDNVGVTRYVVYRDTTVGSSGDSLAETADTTYVDSGTAGDVGINYFYTIKAVDAAGNKSGGSNKVGEFDRDLITAP
jgi:hypothetical protein